jgi:hypothetical protein
LTGEVVRPCEGDDAIELGDVEAEGEGGAAELGPVALALRLRREGQTDCDAIVAGMDAQAAQPDQPPGRALRRRPVAETKRRPLGLVVGDQRIALGPRQHAVLQKIHDARIGVEYRQSIRVRPGDGTEIEPLGEEVMRVQEGSLPLPGPGL